MEYTKKLGLTLIEPETDPIDVNAAFNDNARKLDTAARYTAFEQIGAFTQSSDLATIFDAMAQNSTLTAEITTAQEQYIGLTGILTVVKTEQGKGTASLLVDGGSNYICRFTNGVKGEWLRQVNAGEICNPNQLINAEFKVNQRGVTGPQAVGKRLQDGWVVASGNSIDARNGYVVLSPGSTLCQRLEGSLQTGVYAVSVKTAPGKVIRFSLGNWGGTEKAATVTADADGYAHTILSLINEPSLNSFIYVQNTTSEEVPIYKTMIEHGTICTIKNWYEAYAETLRKCQRYLQIYDRIRVKLQGPQQIPFTLTVPMRICPTIVSYTPQEPGAGIATDYTNTHVVLYVDGNDSQWDTTINDLILSSEL